MAPVILLGELFLFHCILIARGMTTYEYIISERQRSDPAISSRSNTLVRSQSRRSSDTGDAPTRDGRTDYSSKSFLDMLQGCATCSCCASSNKIVPSDSSANSSKKVHVPISPFRLLKSKRQSKDEKKSAVNGEDKGISNKELSNGDDGGETEKEKLESSNDKTKSNIAVSHSDTIKNGVADEHMKGTQDVGTSGRNNNNKLPPLSHDNANGTNRSTTPATADNKEETIDSSHTKSKIDADTNQARVPSCSPSKAYEIPISPKKTSTGEDVTIVASPLDWPGRQDMTPATIEVNGTTSTTSSQAQEDDDGEETLLPPPTENGALSANRV